MHMYIRVCASTAPAGHLVQTNPRGYADSPVGRGRDARPTVRKQCRSPSLPIMPIGEVKGVSGDPLAGPLASRASLNCETTEHSVDARRKGLVMRCYSLGRSVASPDEAEK